MRILVARCEIAYHGRATTRLGSGDRVIMFKDDGSLCVHTDRGYKPLNYMAGPTAVREEGDVIRVYRGASDETLVIVVLEVHSDSNLELADEAQLERDGRRAGDAPAARAGPGRDRARAGGDRAASGSPTSARSICSAAIADGRTVVVEVKRIRAVAAHVEQLTRYCERVDLDPAHAPCRGILVAPEIAPQAQVMCESPWLRVRRRSTSTCCRARPSPN